VLKHRTPVKNICSEFDNPSTRPTRQHTVGLHHAQTCSLLMWAYFRPEVLLAALKFCSWLASRWNSWMMMMMMMMMS